MKYFTMISDERLLNKNMKDIKKVGIVLASDDPETCWVAIRYATFHLAEQNDVKIYFVDSGLRCRDMRGGKYDIVKLVEYFITAGGQVYICNDREDLKTYLGSAEKRDRRVYPRRGM